MNFHDTKARFSRRASDNTKHLSASQNEITRQSNGGKHLQNSSTNTYYIQNKKIFSTDPSSDAVRRSSEFCSARIEQQAGGPPLQKCLRTNENSTCRNNESLQRPFSFCFVCVYDRVFAVIACRSPKLNFARFCSNAPFVFALFIIPVAIRAVWAC